MAESSESHASPDIIRVATPLLLSLLFNWTLHGVLCVQIYVYSYNFPNDRRSVKYTAYFVFLLETVQTALTGADIQYWFVAGFGNLERLWDSHFAPIDVAIFTAVISLIVQGYFCDRIWTLNKRSPDSWICWFIAVSAVIQAVAATWLGITSLRAGKYVLSKAALYLWSIPSAVGNILIAVAMMSLLRRTSGNFSSLRLLRVVRLIVETNALTAALAITIAVLCAAFPDKPYYVYIANVMGKMYSNTFMVRLNNRIHFRDHRLSEHGNSARLPQTEPQPQVSKPQIFPFYSISRLENLNNIHADDTSTD